MDAIISSPKSKKKTNTFSSKQKLQKNSHSSISSLTYYQKYMKCMMKRVHKKEHSRVKEVTIGRVGLEETFVKWMKI